MTAPDLDPRTPVLVGVGQASERIEDPGYRRLSAVELAAEAVRVALADTGADPDAVAAAVDTVAGVRQFEISTPARSHRWAAPTTTPAPWRAASGRTRGGPCWRSSADRGRSTS
ncbi:hypothetical protein ACFSVJ_04440 [Prauserella oleivorans]